MNPPPPPNESFEETVDRICRHDFRYPPDAYHFVREGLDFATREIQQNEQSAPRHVSGRELTEALREYVLREFGPMALCVLRSWRISRTEDFGEIVFNLVEQGKLGKSEQDSRADFADGYDFVEAFARPFEPRQSPPPGMGPRRRLRRTL